MRKLLPMLVGAIVGGACAAPAFADGTPECIRLPAQAQIIIIPPGGCTGAGIVADYAGDFGASGVTILRFGNDGAVPPPPPLPIRRGGVAIVITIGGEGHHGRHHHHD